MPLYPELARQRPIFLFAPPFATLGGCIFASTRENTMKGPKLHDGVALIEVADPLVLTEIESDAILQPFLGERLSDSCIAVQPQAVPDIVRRLQSLGHLPRVHD